MVRNRRERGEGQFGCLVGIAFLALAALIAYKMIPIKVKTADLRETIMAEARSAGQHGNKQIMGEILSKAEQNELPLTEDNVKIERKNQMIKIDVQYTVPVNFPGYTYQWHFHHYTENPVF